MQAAEEAREQVALGGGVSVSCVATAVVGGAGTGRGAEGGERPVVARGVEGVVFEPSAGDGPGPAAGPCDRGRPRGGLEAPRGSGPGPAKGGVGPARGPGGG